MQQLRRHLGQLGGPVQSQLEASAADPLERHDNAVLRDEDDANMVTILLDTDDVAGAREFLGSDSLREAMQGAGVVSQPDLWIANEA